MVIHYSASNPSQTQPTNPTSCPFQEQKGDSHACAFLAIFNDSLDAMVIADSRGKVLRANRAACELFKLSHDQLLHRHLKETTPISIHHWRPFLAQGRITHNFCLWRSDGTQRDVELEGIANMLPDHHLLIFRDVTERQQAEKALRQSQYVIEQISQSISAIVYIYDVIEQRNIYSNRTITDILGYSPESVQAMGETLFSQLIHPDDLANVSARMESFATASDREIIETEYRMRRANGEWCWLYSRDTVFTQTPDGKPQQILGIATDITTIKLAEAKILRLNAELEQRVKERTEALEQANEELKREIRDRQQIEKTLRESEERFRSIFENVSVGIVLLDLDGYILTANEANCRFLGYSPDQILGIHSSRLTHPEDLCRDTDLFNSLVRGKRKNYTIDKRYLRQDGACVWGRLTVSVIKNDDGSPRYIAVVCEDINDRKQMEEVLRESQQKYQTLFKIFPIGISITDEAGNVVEANCASEEILGLSRQEHTSRTYDAPSWQIIRLDGTPMPASEFASVRALTENRVVGNVEMGIVKAKDKITWINVTAAPIPLKDYGVAIAYIDISDRKRMEKALRESQQKYKTLFQILPIGIAITDKQGNLIEANAASEKILALSVSDQIKAKYVSPNLKVIRPDGTVMPRAEFANVRALTENKVIKNHESGIVKPDGKITWISSTVSPIPLRDSGVVIAYLDITERKQAEEALQKATELAVREAARSEIANRAKSEFLTNMSHELRTPLNGILGYTQLLRQDTSLSNQQHHNLTIIHQCGEHLLTLINDILDLAKIEAQKMELYPTEFHLPNFLNSLADLFQLRAQQKDIIFTYQVLSSLPNGIMADNKRLRQVLCNLLSNAIKFTERGEVTFTVSVVNRFEVKSASTNQIYPSPSEALTLTQGGFSHIRASHKTIEVKPAPTNHDLDPIEGSSINYQPSAKIRFQIKDTGVGIEPSQLAQIFLPFHQVSAHSHATEGTGLGLAISQKLIQLMGSEIKVKSIPGQGSVFWFDINLPLVSGSQEPNPSSKRRITGFKGDKRKLMIVDDNKVNRALLRAMLKPVGFEILEAVDGPDCLHKVVKFYPDLILIDLVMPGMDGLETTRRMLKLPQLQDRDIVAIALSASVYPQIQQESLAAGCRGFLPKPVETQQLLDAIALHLGLKWIYAQGQSPSLTESANFTQMPISCLPPSEITALADLVKMGDIQGIIERAESLAQQNSQFEPLTTQLCQLAREFKLKQLRQLIQDYLVDC
ncbi:MAG: PAS domain S-box protein [Coleofasciculus sp. G3-WIS-01]|uniref:PAS domain S-box protein n=1 Tax=Coleofasciculus sp. G3-WIS-01 TaxID=3069528 RepID=UPI003300EE0D